jgi:hypothetical protein
MPNSLSIVPDGGRMRVFSCPACGETIALGCERCRFCSVVIDQQQASAAADLMDRVNLACSEADEIRALMGKDESMLDISPVRNRSRLELYLVPFLLIRWWVRFGALKADDEDLNKARGDMKSFALFGAFGLLVILGLAVYEAHHK